VGSSDENDESEDDDGPLEVIDKSKKSSFTWDLAGLHRNLRSEWKAPAGSHRRRSRADHHRRRIGQLEIESADGNYPVQSNIVIRIRCNLEAGIVSLLVSSEDNRLRGACA
jgi:hypothetical protein